MTSDQNRERSGSELMFGLLKTLMIGYQLWGMQNALALAELAGFLRTTDARLAGLAMYLAGEGLVTLDHWAGTVRLTEHGARGLFGKPPGRVHRAQ